MATLTLSIGQPVPWPSAPMGFAQVCELRRKKVGLCYPFKNGRVARPIVRASELYELLRRPDVQQPFPFHNPFNRACPPQKKRGSMKYEV